VTVPARPHLIAHLRDKGLINCTLRLATERGWVCKREGGGEGARGNECYEKGTSHYSAVLY
jgi:hypothetical protein